MHLSLRQGDVLWARFCRPPSFATRRCRDRKGAKARGLKFEAEAQRHLCLQSEWYLPSPWIQFVAFDKLHWCQPDGLHFDLAAGIITIVEIKYAHTSESHRQLRRLYQPVIGKIFPSPAWNTRLVTLVKWFDPDAAYPESTLFCSDPFAYRHPCIGVHIFRP